LPVNPGLLSDLADQERQLNESLLKQLGSGYATSTPGIEAMKSFNLMKNTVIGGKGVDIGKAMQAQAGFYGY
jgi:hypothetical protein